MNPLAGDGRGGLLPCPFCGGEAQLRQCRCDQATDDQELCVECLTDDCHANMVMWLGDEREVSFAERRAADAAELTAAWNRRAALSAELARREVGEDTRAEADLHYAALAQAFHDKMQVCGPMTPPEGIALQAVINRLRWYATEQMIATPAPVGPGMVVVPVEPTDAMFRSALRDGLGEDRARQVWSGMLAAATPPGEGAE